MQLYHAVSVALAALVASSEGLKVVSTSDPPLMLIASREQPYVEGKTERFLASEAGNRQKSESLGVMEAYKTEGEDEDDADESEERDYDEDDNDDEERKFRFFKKKKKKHKKKHEHEETPTPDPGGNFSTTPEPVEEPRPSIGKTILKNLLD